jgi:hypothetical protein
MRAFSEAIAMLAWVTMAAIIAIGPQVPEPLQTQVSIVFNVAMFLGVAAAGFAGYGMHDTNLSSDDTSFRIGGPFFLVALLILVVIAVPRLDLSWPWKWYVSVLTLVLGSVAESIPIGRSLFKRTKRDV